MWNDSKLALKFKKDSGEHDSGALCFRYNSREIRSFELSEPGTGISILRLEGNFKPACFPT
jgi:hypothetical protein